MGVFGHGVCTTKCVRYSDFKNNQGPNTFLGPCKSCPEQLRGGNSGITVKDDREEIDPTPSWGEVFRIVPNPNNGQFELLFFEPIETGSVKVFNLLGELIWEKQIEEATNKMLVDSQAFLQQTAGVYRVMVESSNGKSVQSLVIIR